MGPVAHPCNPSYSKGRDQEEAQANNFERPYLEKDITEKGWRSGSR
jgi:hypothetical protein